MNLSTRQLAFMDAFGFLQLPGVLEDRIDEIIEEFELVFTRLGGGHDDTARSCIVPFADQSVYLSSLLDDPRIDGIVSILCGEDYNYLSSDGNVYVGTTKWHSDGGWAPAWAGMRAAQRSPQQMVYYKIAVYLDELTGDNGAIRVIPGSHHYGDEFSERLERELRESDNNWGIEDSQVPAVAVETRPGDLVVFPEGTKHGSWGGDAQADVHAQLQQPALG